MNNYERLCCLEQKYLEIPNRKSIVSHSQVVISHSETCGHASSEFRSINLSTRNCLFVCLFWCILMYFVVVVFYTLVHLLLIPLEWIVLLKKYGGFMYYCVSAQIRSVSSKCKASEVCLDPRYPWEGYHLHQVSPMLCTIRWCTGVWLQK